MLLPLDAFVPLHVHTDLSLLDGLSGPYSTVRTAGNNGAPAIAITDHGSLAGVIVFHDAVEWYNSVHAERHAAADCKKAKECHSAAVCAADERCPVAGSASPDGVHGSLAPIRGVYGIETYVADAGREVKDAEHRSDMGHLILLARDEEGWHNLIHLASKASMEGLYYKPRIDMSLLEQYGRGLIGLSSCLGGHIARKLRDEGEDAADALIRRYQAILGPENYYLEVQWHNDQDLGCAGCAAGSHGEKGTDSFTACRREQYNFNSYLLGAAERTGAPVVMTNDSHYARREMAPLEEVLLAIQQRTSMAEVAADKAVGKATLGFDTPDFWIKGRRDMQAALNDWYAQAKQHDPDMAAVLRAGAASWLDASVGIAARCTLPRPFETGKIHFPVFKVPAEFMPDDIADPDERMAEGAKRYLAHMTWERSKRRYPKMTEGVRRLIAGELQGICEMHYAPYFLIVAEYIDWARSRRIRVGLGRGSAPGSVVTYVMGITGLDPVKRKLTVDGIGFARFLNPEITYSIKPDAFGRLPQEALDMPAPPAAEMEAAVRDPLNAWSSEWRAKAAAADLDKIAGREPKLRRDGSAGPWLRFESAMRLLTEEWDLIRRRGLIEIYWRWLTHIRAGGMPGDRNDVLSRVAYALGLTTIQAATIDGDQLPFLPDAHYRSARKGMPDIDTDFSPAGRDEVLHHVVEEYGADHVCQIATYGAMLSKSAILDVNRAKGLMTSEEAQRLTLLIPKKFAAGKNESGDDIPGVSLREMIESDLPTVVSASQPLRDAMAADPRVDDVIRTAARIEGVKRGVSTHACGVLITPRPVTDHVAVMRIDKGTGMQAVFDGTSLEMQGLIKFDFLGLTNLDVNDACTDRLLERRGISLDWQEDLPDDDPAAMRVFCEGRTEGIFQFSSSFATGIIKSMQPKLISELAVATALGRPGPMEFIPEYLRGRAKGKTSYDDPVFARYAAAILDPTYGTMVYQEQMMRLVVAVAGFTLPESDALRKACSKKKLYLLAPWREKWVAGATAAGVGAAFAEAYWDAKVVPFAQYAFNQSHAAVYAETAYTQAYLKAHYELEFMAALMTVAQHESTDKGDISPLAKAVAEARRSHIVIARPDINASTERIEIEPDPEAPGDFDRGILRLSLAAPKGIGTPPVAAIVAERRANGPFTSFADFFTRMILRDKAVNPDTGKAIPNPVGKTASLVLARVGAFDDFDDRTSLVARITAYFGTTAKGKRAAISWEPEPGYDPSAPRSSAEMDEELALLGVYASGHPADAISAADWESATTDCAAVAVFDPEDDAEARRADREAGVTTPPSSLVGVITAVSWKANKSKPGGKFGGKIEDGTASCNFMYWQPRDAAGPEVHAAFAAFRASAEAGTIARSAVRLTGRVSYEEKWDPAPKIEVSDWALLIPAPYVAESAAPPPVVKAVPADPRAGGNAETALDDLLGA
jgi:DNA polymerase III alpha subunit